MKKRIFSILLCLCMTAVLIPSTVFAWTAPDNISASNAEYYQSGALKEITANFNWHTASATGRLVLMTNRLRSAGDVGTSSGYGDFTDFGYYGTTFSSFADVLSYDTANNTFGIVYAGSPGSINVGTNAMTMSLSENLLPLNTNKLYYVYLWTDWGYTYPDTLICAIRVNDGAVKYASATGRNTYDESAFNNVISRNTYNVTVTAAEHMTRKVGSGEATQNNLTSAMTPVVYTADSNYSFTTDYSVTTVNGIMVRRDSQSQITVYGTPSANAAITLTAPTLTPPTPPVVSSTYTVKFDPNGGDGTMSDMTVSTTSDTIITLSQNIFTRSGYVFAGWSDVPGGDTVIYNDEAPVPAANAGDAVTLYAVWNKRSSGHLPTCRTIRFETNGGNTITSQAVLINGTATEPEVPTRDGYIFDGWFSDNNFTEEYDFNTKVTENITLYAKWYNDDAQEPEEDNTPTVDGNDNTDIGNKPQADDWENPFIDVNNGDWFFESVKYLNKNGLMSGTSATRFSPDMQLTRAMLVTILYRADGSPAADKNIPFTDVAADAYYADAVAWAYQNGIVFGITDKEFAPDSNITREQIAAILHRYAEYKGYDVSQGGMQIREFDDYNSISDYALEAMSWAVNAGLLKGKSATTVNPKDFASRAEAAAMLHRFIELYAQ